MHAVKAGVRLMLVSVTATGLALLPATAFADKRHGGGSQGGQGGGGGYHTSGAQSDGSLTSRITFSGSTRGSDAAASNPVTPVSDWTPPACWYEPISAEEFAKRTEAGYDQVVNDSAQPNYAKVATAQYRDIYKDGKYKNYNLKEKDEGNWWVAVQDPSRLDDLDAWNCDELPFWVKNGATPEVKNAVTPQVLAELAYNRIQLPTEDVTLAPKDSTKVNLPTWAWLDDTAFKKVSVTASLNVAGLDIRATTTAKPVALKLEPGTGDAETYPAGGVCEVNADGSIGAAYAEGDADRTPPCGIKYLRSSGNGTFKLKATVTWQISWTGTGGAGGDLPDGTFGNTQDVTVREIQAVNR
ncbi:hypothetical protein [Streptomyces sp. L2]|uniref:hypothetical protein n=1 Tax=Streptomyces sp. L2 TaxID=2162665 RepID=UPI001F512049|nr:hypothetical protein [Streptomyces sp. L2]